ncbi:MAG TPA: RNA polymerase sigma factor [Caulobacteraceae bacterium]
MADVADIAGRHDVELAALAATGQRAAFGELVRRHGSAVRALVRRMGADAALADDIAQDACLAAFERIAEFRGEGTFQAWLKRIASRLYLKRVKRTLAQALAQESAGSDTDASPGLADARLDLDEALRSLAPAERICVSLCYGAGFSHGEAAELLNTPLGTVKSHVKRGLDRLKQRLGGGADETGRRVNG